MTSTGEDMYPRPFVHELMGDKFLPFLDDPVTGTNFTLCFLFDAYKTMKLL